MKATENEITNEGSYITFRQFRDNLLVLISGLDKTSDLKQTRNELQEIRELIRESKLLREHKDDLFVLVQDAFNKLQHLRDMEQENYQKEAENNYMVLQEVVKTALQKASSSIPIAEKKEILISAQEKFRGVKLLREQREELFSELQSAFDELKTLQDIERYNFESEAARNYQLIKQKIDDTLISLPDNDDFNSSRKLLSGLQEEIRTYRLTREQRDELISVVRQESDCIRKKQEKEKELHESESRMNYDLVKPRLTLLLDDIMQMTDLRAAKRNLISFQSDIRDKLFLREHREDIRNIMNMAFTELNSKLTEEKIKSGLTSAYHYKELKKQVEDGFKQANESVEYKKTRNFLKTVQSHFRGAGLGREEREELYTKLQLSFAILNNRVDEYFRNKKKFWDIKMQFKIANLEQEKFLIESSLEDDREKLNELNDRLLDIEQDEKENTVIEIHIHKIRSLQEIIECKQIQISETEKEIEEINAKLNPQEDDEESADLPGEENSNDK